jgi:predicted nucleic acid-binding protein
VFVIDASVTLAWCFADESSPYADAILERLTIEEARVPSIWPLEVANGLRSAERRGRLRPEEVPRLRELLSALPVGIDEVSLASALGDVLAIGRSLDISVYDASYIELAVREDAPLATVDDRLRGAAERAGVELVG